MSAKPRAAGLFFSRRLPGRLAITGERMLATLWLPVGRLMLPDLERLIRLQELENTVEDTRRTIEAIPSKLEALEGRVAARSEAVTTARKRLDDNRAARLAIEKDLALVQSRLSKFKDQLMAVKTNKEYQAMQKEIAVAEHEVRSLEDQILEQMLDADDQAAAATQAEKDRAAEQAAAEQQRVALDKEYHMLERHLEQSAEARSHLVKEIAPRALGMFEHVAKQRKGVALAEARHGHCAFCNVRLRPQVFNDIRLNDSLIQCESCLRILYYVSASIADPQP